MIIHFVAQAFDYSVMVSDAKRIDIGDETHDPITGVTSFHSFFDRIDGRGKRETMRLDSEKVRFAFWNRDEFLEAVREICQEDVYIQASDWYSMRLAFVRVEDLDAFEARLAVPRPSYERTYDRGLRPEIEGFLRSGLDVTYHDYDCIEQSFGDGSGGGEVTYRFREESVAQLVEIKFACTKVGDHSIPAPPIPEHIAA